MSARYYPTYEIREDLDEGDVHWLGNEQGEGPCAIEDVIDVCAHFRVAAVLRNVAGAVVGHVDPNGDYRVTG